MPCPWGFADRLEYHDATQTFAFTNPIFLLEYSVFEALEDWSVCDEIVQHSKDASEPIC